MFEGTAAAAAADAGDDEDEDDEAFLDFFCPSALCDQEPLALASSFSKSLSLSPLSSSLVLPLGKVVTGGGSTGSHTSAAIHSRTATAGRVVHSRRRAAAPTCTGISWSATWPSRSAPAARPPRTASSCPWPRASGRARACASRESPLPAGTCMVSHRCRRAGASRQSPLPSGMCFSSVTTALAPVHG